MSFFIAFGLALLLTPLARRSAVALGIVDRPTEALSIHSRPVPIFGGPPVVVAALAAAVAFGAELRLVIVVAALGALAFGVADDVWDLSPRLRLLVHFAFGLVVVGGGVRMESVGAIGAVGVVLLVVASVNAVNLVDGQDGLAAGLGAVAAGGLAVLLAMAGSPHVALALGLCGALCGFLVFNRPPARIFLGDGGANAVGLVLAVLAALVVDEFGWTGLAAAGVVLGIFAFDFVFTFLRRVVGRAPVAEGDRNHSYDLLARNIPRNRVTVLFLVAGAVLGVLGVTVAVGPAVLVLPVITAFVTTALLAGWLLLRKLPSSNPAVVAETIKGQT